MDLKLAEHVRNNISLRYKQKKKKKKKNDKSPIFRTFLAKNQFLPILCWKSTFAGRSCFSTSLWRQRLTDFQDIVYWKEETIPYTMVPNNYTFILIILTIITLHYIWAFSAKQTGFFLFTELSCRFSFCLSLCLSLSLPPSPPLSLSLSVSLFI